jgi:outer membrane protease
MKNISLFTVLVIITLVSVAGVPAFGQETEGRYAFTLAPVFGMVYGQAEEIVYPSTTKVEYLSQLIWDMQPVLYYGARLNFALREPMRRWGLFSEGTLKIGIPGITGKMEDRDWQSTDSDEMTDYSSHDNQTNEFLWAEGTAGISFPVDSLFLLKLSANVSYTRFAFAGLDGFGIYASGTVHHEFSGNIINYSQDWLIFAPGISVDISFFDRFSAAFQFQISPFIWCTDEDQHILRKIIFKDYTEGGVFFEPRAAVAFHSSHWLAFSLELAYRQTSGAKGLSYQKNQSSAEYFPAGTAGTGFSFVDASLMVKVRL